MTETLEREMTESLGRVPFGEPRGDTARCCTGNGALAPGKSNPVNSNVAPNVGIPGAWLERALRSEHRSEITKSFWGNPCLAPRGGGAEWSAATHHIGGQNYPMDPPRPLAEQTSLLPPWCAVSPAPPSRSEGSRALRRIPHGTYTPPSRDKSFSYALVRGSPRRSPPGRACPWAAD